LHGYKLHPLSTPTALKYRKNPSLQPRLRSGNFGLAAATPFLMRNRDRFLEQIGQPGAGFVATFEAIAATGYQPSLAHCVEVATAYLSALKER
jgi:hypothetical protein